MSLDAVIVGSGPNGLAAAITLAREGRSVLVLEAADSIGGGLRSAALTLPGFVHDVCSAIHPLGIASPFFQSIPLHEYGLEWVHPDVPVAHPLEDGRVALVHRSLEATAKGLGADGTSYHRLLSPFVSNADRILRQVLGPVRWPRHPLLMTRFALRAVQSADRLARHWFRDDIAQGMFAGMAAHAVLPLEQRLTAAVGLMFCITAHGGGWPLPRGGTQRIADAMAAYLQSIGGTMETGVRVDSLKDVPTAKAVLFDTSPGALSRIAGDVLPLGYRRRLQRFRHGPGVFKVDWALDGPIPWKNNDCARAGTVHVGGTLREVAAAERAAWSGTPAERPFVLVAQQSLFDSSRAPRGKHTGWAYCHVPHGSTFDMTDRIESQIDRFAPGFRDRILNRCVTTPTALENYNPNYVGGDITGGVMDLGQIFTRPVARWNPYTTPVKNVFICSLPRHHRGAGVHGMCGYYAAKAALRIAP